MVDEFIDVNYGEKQFMKVWNSYMMEQRLMHGLNSNLMDYIDLNLSIVFTIELLPTSKCFKFA